MRRLTATLIRIRLFFLEFDIQEAEGIQNLLRRELPAMHNERRDLLQRLWAVESDLPA